MAPVLSVRNLYKVYPGKVPFVAVNRISFDLDEGEVLGLLGPNGAGKTTTIQMLLSTLSYTEGSIQYFGKDLHTHRSEILQQVSYASAYTNLPPQLTVAQNLDVLGRLYRIPGKVIRERIDPLLERFGIGAKKHILVSQLSAGQLTRLMLVKAFMVQPRIILFDEPTASLDPDMAQEVCHYILEMRRTEKISILFTSHKMAEVAEICDRVLFLQSGVIIANDTPENLARSVSQFALHLVIGQGMELAVELCQKMDLHHNVENRFLKLSVEEAQIARFLAALTQEGVVYSSIKIVEPTLEDYFLKKAGKK